MADDTPRIAYEWERSFPVPAEVVGDTVEKLQARNGGVCAPGALVDEARPESSPLHRLFEWDDDVAAEAWRKQQARRVIGSLRVRIVEDEDALPAPAFVHVRIVDAPEVDDEGDDAREGYMALGAVLSDDELSERAVREVLTTVRGFQRRYRAIAKLKPLWDALNELEEEG